MHGQGLAKWIKNGLELDFIFKVYLVYNNILWKYYFNLYYNKFSKFNMTHQARPFLFSDARKYGHHV